MVQDGQPTLVKFRPKPGAVAAYKQGNRLEQKGKSQEALEAFARAVEIDDHFWDGYLARGRIFAKLGDNHRSRVDTSYGEWLKHRWMLEPYRVRPKDKRTTPAPVVDIAKIFPELAATSKTTIRLNPRYGDEPARGASKFGGTFLWPADEPWPVCESHHIPFVGVLQLHAKDFPEMTFFPGTDLFQLLWCPREHYDHEECGRHWADPAFFWRRSSEITKPLQNNPLLVEPYYEYVPFPCRLMPERILEYPSVYELEEDLANRIDEWHDQNLNKEGYHEYCYEWEFSVCQGTKIGGHVHWIQSWWIPTCSCGRLMEHLLTIETVEWNGSIDRRWTPREEQRILARFGPEQKWTKRKEELMGALWIPTGLSLGDAGHMQLFYCPHCPDWPIIPAIESC